jgi:hypothetical protein
VDENANKRLKQGLEVERDVIRTKKEWESDGVVHE